MQLGLGHLNLPPRRGDVLGPRAFQGQGEVGQAATVTADGLPGKVFTGKVSVALSRMGKRAPQSDAPNEMKDLYYREVLIDLDGGDDLPTNLRVQVRIEAKPQERR